MLWPYWMVQFSKSCKFRNHVGNCFNGTLLFTGWPGDDDEEEGLGFHWFRETFGRKKLGGNNWKEITGALVVH